MDVLVDSLHFPVGKSQAAVNVVTLSSSSDSPLQFKVKLTHPDHMLSRPSKGVLPARGTVAFEVSLKADPESVAVVQPAPRILVQCSSDSDPSVAIKRKLVCLFTEPAADVGRYHYVLGGETFASGPAASAAADISLDDSGIQSPMSSPVAQSSAVDSREVFSLNVMLRSLRSAADDLATSSTYTIAVRRGSNEGRSSGVSPSSARLADFGGQCVELRNCGAAQRKFLVLSVLQDGQEVGQVKVIANDADQIGGTSREAELPVKRASGGAGWTLVVCTHATQQTPASPASVSQPASPRPFLPKMGLFADLPPVAATESSAENPLERNLGAHLPKEQNIQVLVRVRPVLKHIQESTTSMWTIEPGNTCISDPDREYDFDCVIGPDKRNQDVWEMVGPRFVEAVTEGMNGTIFMYGQTASGKTHTMFGERDEPGLTPLLFTHLFRRISEMTTSAKTFVVRASYFEIYNEELFCLLTPRSKSGEQKKLQIREKQEKGGGSKFIVPDLAVEEVGSMEECQRLLKRGGDNKTMGYSNINERSSRSHTIFHLMVACTTVSAGKSQTTVANLNFCDLAGSETLSEKGDGVQKKETGHINLSLTHLKNVISELAKRKQGFINYRNSTLTKILKQSLGGNARTTVIVTMSPAKEWLRESKSSLLFGQLARTIKNRVRVNVEQEDTNLREEVARLRQELARRTEMLEQYQSTATQMHEELKQLGQEYQKLIQENELLRSGASRQRALSHRLGIELPAGGGAAGGEEGEGSASVDSEFVEALQHKLNEKDREIIDLKITHRRELVDKTRQLHDALAAKEFLEEKAGQEETALELMQKDDRLDQLVWQILSYLHFGTKVTRVEGKGELHTRVLYLATEDGQRFLCVCPVNPATGKGDKDKPIEKVAIRDIKKTVMGQYGSLFAKADAKLASSFSQSFSINSKKKKHHLDLVCQSESDFEAWIQSLNHLTGQPAEWGDPLNVSEMQDYSVLDQDEKNLCINMHIIPSDYLYAKGQVLNKEGRFITLFDVRTLSCLDLYHSQKLFAFFLSKEWIGQRKLFFLDTEKISRTANVYEVEYEDEAPQARPPAPVAAASSSSQLQHAAYVSSSHQQMQQYNAAPPGSFQHPPPYHPSPGQMPVKTPAPPRYGAPGPAVG